VILAGAVLCIPIACIHVPQVLTPEESGFE